MTNVINFAGVTVAIVGSMALALWIEWVSLRGLMRLMPTRGGALSKSEAALVATDAASGNGSAGGGKQ
jgi:hypothetical protein